MDDPRQKAKNPERAAENLRRKADDREVISEDLYVLNLSLAIRAIRPIRTVRPLDAEFFQTILQGAKGEA